ncbi:MAG: YggT family protein [Bacillota bacterium]
MQAILAQALTIFVRILSVLIWARILMGWFRPKYRTSNNGWFFTIEEYVWRATEPLLAPIRNILPSTGMIDFSPIVLWFLIDIIHRVLLGILLGR